MLINLKYLLTAQENLRFSFGKANIIFAALILFISFLNNEDCSVWSNLSTLSVIPVVTYSNADTMKNSAVKENKGKSGVYRWTNIISNKTYIGSSSDLGSRFRNYYKYNFLTLRQNQGMIIVKALLKSGYSNFKLEILEYCENLINREQYYLDLLQPEYNILKVAGSSLGFKHSEESLAKVRLQLSKLNFEKGIKVEVTDIEKNTIIVYDSIRKAGFYHS